MTNPFGEWATPANVEELDVAAREREVARRRHDRWQSFLRAEFPLSDEEKQLILSESYERTMAIKRVGSWYVKDYQAGSPRTALLLCGPIGTGKTFAAAVAAYRIGSARHMPASDLQYCPEALAVIDDLGTEDQSERGWSRKFFDLVNSRKGRPLIITTNLTPDLIKTRYDARIIDRLRACCKVSAVSGNSLRKTADKTWEK